MALVPLNALLLGASPAIVTFGLVATLGAGSPSSSDFQPELEAVLSHDLGFSSADLRDLERGRVVKHILPPRAPEEVGAVGAVRIRGSRDHLIAAYRDIVTFRKSVNPPVLAIGRFSERLAPSDLDALTTDDFDLRGCKVAPATSGCRRLRFSASAPPSTGAGPAPTPVHRRSSSGYF
jgi:hypothetical protein